MKNIFKLLLVTLLFSVSSFAQSKDGFGNKLGNATETSVAAAKDGVSTVYNDSKDATKEIYSQIKKASPKAASLLGKMAQKLEVGADAVWSVLVKQQLVWSICFLILTLASLYNWYVFNSRYLKLNSKILSDPIIGKRTVVKSRPNPEFNNNYYELNNKYLNSDYSSDRRKTEVIEFKKELEYNSEEDFIIDIPLTEKLSGFRYLHLIICIGLSGLSFYNFPAMLTGFINPEFGAMKNIMEFAISFK
jgi:hypothetical protein